MPDILEAAQQKTDTPAGLSPTIPISDVAGATTVQMIAAPQAEPIPVAPEPNTETPTQLTPPASDQPTPAATEFEPVTLAAPMMMESVKQPEVNTVTPAVDPPPPLPSKFKKKPAQIFMLASLIMLLMSLPVAVYFISQQNKQLTESRSKAASCSCLSSPGDFCGGSRIGNSDCPPNGPDGQACCIEDSGSNPPPPNNPTSPPSNQTGWCTNADGSKTPPGTYGCVPGCKRGSCVNGNWVYNPDNNCAGCSPSAPSATPVSSNPNPTSPPASGGSTCTGGSCPSGKTCAKCPEGQCSNVYSTDVCGTIGETRCNGNLLATCTKLSSFCSLGYWKASGTCTNNTPKPYASVTIKPNPTSPASTGTVISQCQNGLQNRDQKFWLICNCTNGCKQKTDNTPGGGGTGWVCDENCQLKPINTLPTAKCSQIDFVHEGTSDYCGVAKINCPTECQTGGTQPTSPPNNPTSPPNPTTPLKTPTNAPVAQCNDIRVYNTQGTDITAALVSKTALVKPGDKLTIGIKGANATKARFRVNGAPTNYQETTTKNSKGEFTADFILPADTTRITIEAQVTQNGNTWF